MRKRKIPFFKLGHRTVRFSYRRSARRPWLGWRSERSASRPRSQSISDQNSYSGKPGRARFFPPNAPATHSGKHRAVEHQKAEKMSKNTEITVVAEPATPKSAAASIPAIVEATVQIPVDKPQDPLPRIIITGPDRTISQVALEVGQILAPCGIYLFGGEPAILDPATQALVPVKPGVFRTWLRAVLKIYLKQTKDDVRAQDDEQWRRVDDSHKAPQFRQQLREVERVHHALQPVIRSNGDVELLPPGYDRESKILTVGRDLEYDTRLPLDKAKEFLIRLFRDFPFADKERSLAVALAAMLTVYGLSMLPPKTIVPAFKFGGNQPGLGKGLLAQIAIGDRLLGFVPTGVSPKDETEMRKLLFATAREGRLVVFFDNVTGRLASPSLESFLTHIYGGGPLAAEPP